MKEDRLIALISPALEALGLECLGIEYAPHASNSLLRVYIDTAGRAVTVEDCERASREIAALMDVEDPIQSRYTLEVSSPGLDRPLFSAAQFEKHMGEVAKVTLNVPQDGRRRLQGRIMQVQGTSVVVDVDGNDFKFEFGNVAKARLVPDFDTILPGRSNKPGSKSAGVKAAKPQDKNPNNRARQPRAPQESR